MGPPVCFLLFARFRDPENVIGEEDLLMGVLWAVPIIINRLSINNRLRGMRQFCSCDTVYVEKISHKKKFVCENFPCV